MAQMDDKARQALIYEGAQAWEHYRHIENQRNSFMAFLLTVAFAATGLLVSIASRPGNSATTTALTVACPVSCAVLTISAITHWSIDRFRYILEFYRRMLLDARRELLVGIDRHTDELIAQWDVIDYLPPTAYGLFVGPQTTAEIITALATIASASSTLLISLSTSWVTGYGAGDLVAIYLSAAYTIPTTIYVFLHEIQSYRYRSKFQQDRRHQ
jgi:hypothetical protein